jgi:hypothetical protein
LPRCVLGGYLLGGLPVKVLLIVHKAEPVVAFLEAAAVVVACAAVRVGRNEAR